MCKKELIRTGIILIIWTILLLVLQTNYTGEVEGKSKYGATVASYSYVDIYTDKDTKLQYLVFENTGGGIYAIPRVDENGKHMKEK